MGRVAVVTDEHEFIMLTPQVTYYRIGQPNRLDAGYLKYAFLSPRFQHQLNSSSDQSTRKFIGITAQRHLWIPLPRITQQKAIAGILGLLDDKIELNRRMNETLEAMARAIFKSWFVDFDPVRAKLDGRQPPGMDANTAALFPDRLEHTELGLAPKGWGFARVSDIGKVICGKTPSTKVAEYYGHGMPFITIPDMHGRIFATTTRKSISKDGAFSQQKKTLPPGAICVSCIATPGLTVITSTESQTNQQINSVVPKHVDSTYFWFWTLRDLGDEIRAGGSGGSVLMNLSTGRFSDLRVLVPPHGLRSAYQKHVAHMFERILKNEEETETLTALRDALLPKLLSGEIRVADAKRIVASAQDDPNEARERLNHDERNGRSSTTTSGTHRSIGADRNDEGETTPDPSAIDEVDTDEVMAAFRQELRGRAELSRDELVADVAQRLGIRNGEVGRESLKNHLRAAIRRKIVGADGPDVVFAETPTMAEYTTDELIGFVRSVTRKGVAYEREELTRAVAAHLGFARVTDNTREAVESAIAEAVRQGTLVREGTTVRREG